MEVVTLLFQQNLIMFLYMMIGFALYKNKLLTSAGSGELGKLLLYVILPTTIARSYMQEFSPQKLAQLGLAFAASAAAILLSMAVSALLLGKRSAVRNFGAAFSNAGFIGIPLIQMTLGTEAVFFVAPFVTIINLCQWTYGVWVITGDKGAIDPKKLPKNPFLFAFLIGLVFFFLPIRLPAALSGMVGTIASMNGPLAMIVLGAYLAQVPLRDLFTNRESYLCTAVRLLVIPALTLLLFCLIPGENRDVKMTILLAAATPVGSNVAIYAQLYHKDYRAAVTDVCLSTICSIATMPLILAVAQMLW